MTVIELLIERSVNSLNRPFTYFYNGSKTVKTGFRVLVTFNNQELVGYVINTYDFVGNQKALEEKLGFAISEINDVIDQEPLLNDDLLMLSEEVSEYYLAPKIAVLQSMLPPSLSPRKSSLKKPKIAYEQYLIVKEDNINELTPKQLEIFRLIKENHKVLKREIKSPSIIDKLLSLGRIEIIKEEKNRLELPTYKKENQKPLTDEQKKVVDEFNNSDDEVYLLQGVTGSGKSEVYLTLSEQVLKRGKQVLMLVPEISLTPMMVEYFLKRFQNKVAILHSELTPSEKYDEYRKIARGEAEIVVGARSAIFAPLQNIGLIILDEEHSESYKQDVVPFYHAREVAIMRGKTHHAKVLLGSATPSLEVKARASKGVFHLLRLDQRINNQPLPKTSIVNLGDYNNIDRDSFIFSFKLREAISNVLKNHEQAILLINRRGFSSSMTCRKCGHVFRCPTCGIPLTYHKSNNLLKCHHCDYVMNAPEVCPECGSKYFMKTGFGTERIEDEVHRLFPEARTLRLDSDVAKIRSKIPSIINSFRQKQADILIGTQMIAKGHDFPDVTLVGVVLADIGLTLPSFRSNERAFQLITQAVGRSGRKDKNGVAIIQTYIPNHYAITMAARQDYDIFYTKEMGERKVRGYPPYYYLSAITLSSKSEDTVVQTAYQVADFLNQKFQNNGMVLGPAVPYIYFEKNRYLRMIMVKYKDQLLARKILKELLNTLSNKTAISITVNVDPYNL